MAKKKKSSPEGTVIKPGQKTRLRKVDTNELKKQVKKWQDKNKGAFQ